VGSASLPGSGRPRLSVRRHEGNCKAIVSLVAHGLERRGAHTRLGSEDLDEAPHAVDTGITARGVGHGSFADNMTKARRVAGGEDNAPVKLG
jgi:hypothetical protein